MSNIYDCSIPSERRAGIDAAIKVIGDGQLVSFPTDTVYGAAADAFDIAATSALRIAKNMEMDQPLPVMVGTIRTLHGLMSNVPDYVIALVESLWPGPLTLVVPTTSSLQWEVPGKAAQSGTSAVSVRMPMHPIALQILRQTGPLAVASANLHNYPPATSYEGAYQQLGAAIRVYLNSGEIAETQLSTVIDITGERPELVRAGAVSGAEIQRVLADFQEMSA